MGESVLWMVSVVAFVFGAFYSGSETAFIAANRVRMRHLAARGNRRAQHVLDMLSDPERFLSAVLVGTNFAVIGCTTAFTAISTRRYGDDGATIATLILVPFFLIFNEIIPKGLFLYYSNRAALLSVEPLRAFTVVLGPVVAAFSWATATLTRVLPSGGRVPRVNMTMEELLFHIGDSSEAGLLAPETTALVDRAIALKNLCARDVMVPIEETVMVDADAPVDSYADVFAREGFSRFPVHRGERRNVTGVMSVHEYMTTADRETLRERLAPPYRISLDTPIVDVLFRMREQGRHMAMIHDADGVIVGMATMEDILERFVGAIADEFH
jgi:CBS domain containing-hemolysin-like protein